ncbi:MAG TPA: glycoside hydrolase family 97 N-terminal domain-containing protein, partial [Lacibacter sp.]|nr:glycoside hydrolase family 97 N-terminal domain-containing protein [Lacibacter sp.]
MNRFLVTIFLLFSLASAYSQQVIDSTKVLISSPDQKHVLSFYQKQSADGTRTMFYKLDYRNQPVILESVLDIQLDNNLSERAMALKVDKRTKWCENLVIKKIVSSVVDASWRPAYGERSMVTEKYNAATIEMIKDDNPIYPINVELRVYNEGVAFRFFFPENVKGTYYRIMNEHTEFALPEGTKAWHHSWAQAPYKLLPLKDWPDESERPLTLELPNGLFACLAEAQMVDYARTKFKLSNEKPNTIVTSMYTPADLISPFATPWRVIMVGETAGELVEHNDLILNLNQPSKIADQSWIKPGKIMRVMTQTTKDAYENIDFAVKHNLQYILFDWKWYGPAFSFTSDAT